MTATEGIPNELGHMEWLRADTIKPWHLQRDLNKAAARKIAREFDPDMLGTLVISRHDGEDYLLDGQHRLSAIRDELGWKDQNVPCLVYEGLTQEQEAKLFNAQAPGKRRELSPLHSMFVSFSSGDKETARIVRTIERSGLGMAWRVPGNTGTHTANTVGAARALQNVTSLYGHYRTETVLRNLREGLGPTTQAYTSNMIRGMMMFEIRYEGIYDRRSLIDKLQAAGVDAINRQSLNIQGALKVDRNSGVGRAIHQCYNHKRSARRLHDWIDNFKLPENTAHQGAAIIAGQKVRKERLTEKDR